MNNKPFWEKAYQETDKTFDGGKPSEDIIDLVKYLPQNSSVLDIGCGDGRNSIFLAKMGHKVTAINISQSGVNKLKQKANDLNFKINTKVMDANSFEFKIEYELVIAYGVLHLIQHEKRKELLTKIKKYTKLNGYNIILVFTNELPPPTDLAEFMVGLYNEGELFQEYINWEIIKKSSYVLNDEHPGGIKHQHPINKIISKKISYNKT